MSISRGFYIFYPIFEDHFFAFKEVFSENYVLMYGQYSRAVFNQERLMMARIRQQLIPESKIYILLSLLFPTVSILVDYDSLGKFLATSVLQHRAATLTGNKVSHKIWSILKYYIYCRKYMVQHTYLPRFGLKKSNQIELVGNHGSCIPRQACFYSHFTKVMRSIFPVQDC